MYSLISKLEVKLSRSASLNKQLALVMILVLSISSFLFLIIVFSAYRIQLQKERAEASFEINEVLQSALENAMLKRDLDGLQQIVNRMAQQSSISRVSIINPQGEIRFTSQPELKGTHFSALSEAICLDCGTDFKKPENTTTAAKLENGREVIRSFNPVANREECTTCHGPIAVNPINGILIVDYDASSIKSKAMKGMGGLLLAGLCVIVLTLVVLWYYMRRQVLTPISRLSSVSSQLATGNLSARAPDEGVDELSILGKTINTMAVNLQASIRTVKKNEAYLQTLIDANPDGIRVIDSEYRIIKFNKAYREMLGTQKASMTYCYQSSHNRSSPCIPTLVSCPLHEIKKRKQAFKTMQVFYGSGGNTFETQVYSAPLAIGSDEDTTVIVQSIRDLRHDIKYSQEQRLSSLGQLAAGVGHEIMNPLTSIRLALQSTLTNLRNKPESVQDSLEYLELVDGEIDRCIDVTNRLRKLSALPDEHLQIVNINNAIEETASLLKYEAEQRDVDVDLILSDQMPRVIASESNIRTVVLNLIQNAYHAMPQGGCLSIGTEVKNDRTYSYFEDTGIGISEKDIARIFDPFYSNRADGKHGMGLGLSICHSLVEQHSGEIRVESPLCSHSKKGTRFIVIFPLAR